METQPSGGEKRDQSGLQTQGGPSRVERRTKFLDRARMLSPLQAADLPGCLLGVDREPRSGRRGKGEIPHQGGLAAGERQEGETELVVLISSMGRVGVDARPLEAHVADEDVVYAILMLVEVGNLMGRAAE